MAMIVLRYTVCLLVFFQVVTSFNFINYTLWKKWCCGKKSAYSMCHFLCSLNITFACNSNVPALRHLAFTLQTQILLALGINANNRMPCVQPILLFLHTDGFSLLFPDTGDVINCYGERQFSNFKHWRRKSLCFTLVKISFVNVSVNWSGQRGIKTECFSKGIWQKEMRQIRWLEE